VIDFRYHLVSIVAVFLALAIGIVIGASALKPETLRVLDKASKDEKQQIIGLQTDKKNMQAQIASDQAFAQAAAPQLLANLLAGQKVVIVTAPGADGSTVSGISTALHQAGAKLTGQVQMQPSFFDTSASTQNSLDTLATKLAPAGVTPGSQEAQLGANALIGGQEEAGQVIASALVSTDGPGLPSSETKTILGGFAQAGFLQISPAAGASDLAQADLAVVVIPAAAPTAGDSDPENLALLALSEQLMQASHGTVMAGSLPGSGTGSAIDDLVNGSTGIQLSSVDNANTETGQILVAQALNYLLAGKKPAAYGVVSGAVPSPAPTPAATPLTTPSPAKSAGRNKSTG
jgi:Copper transport outer membrane protein, MctB